MSQGTQINFYNSPMEQTHYRMESGSFIDSPERWMGQSRDEKYGL